MDKSFDDDIFRQAAQRASQRPSFVAAALSEYCSLKRIEEKQLADYLGCSQQDLPKLALCRKPSTETQFSFRKDVEQIASYVGIEWTRLAQLFREVESLKALRSASRPSHLTPTQGVLIAARDHSKEASEQDNHNETVETTNESKSTAKPDSNNSQSERKSSSEHISIDSDEYEAAYGEKLAQTLDLNTWLPGEDLAVLYGRLAQEVEEAVHQENRIRQEIRQVIFPRLRTRPGAPRNAGVYQAKIADIERVHHALLFNGAVEACDGTSVMHDTLAVTIAQIGVCSISYQGKQGSYVHQLYRRELRQTGLNPVQEVLEILERRKKRDGFDDVESRRDKLSNLARRGIMTYMERAVLLYRATAPWRMGHGNPIAYELLTGSGMTELLQESLKTLKGLVEHQKFVFVPSSTSDRALMTIGNALRPLEYAIVDTMEGFVNKVLSGHYSGEWKNFLPVLQKFASEEGNQIIVGVYRASEIAPSQLFYAHINHAHEAALIALADSVLQEHRGFPMLIDLADNICRTTFGADSFNSTTQLAYSEADAPYQYMTERQTRR